MPAMFTKPAFIDKDTFFALHLDKLVSLIQPVTSLGRKIKSHLLDFSACDENSLKEEFRRIQTLMQVMVKHPGFTGNLQAILAHFDDISLTLEKLSKQNTLEIFEIFEIKSFVFFYQTMRKLLLEHKLDKIAELADFTNLFRYLDADGQNTPHFQISATYSSDLQEIQDKITKLKSQYLTLEKELYLQICITLQIEKIEPLIVVSRMNTEQIQKIENSGFFYLEAENFANLHYRIHQTKDQLELAKRIRDLETELEIIDKKVRTQITARIKEYSDDLNKALSLTAWLDFLCAKSVFALKYDCHCPKFNHDSHYDLPQADNIYVHSELSKQDIEFQKIDLFLETKVSVLSGANMGGKTTILKSLGIIVWMAGVGIPVPCPKANIQLPDFIFYSGPSKESNRSDLSSFASEMVILNDFALKDGKGLFLVDEFARGTNPEEGQAFFTALLDYFVDKKKYLLTATHFLVKLQATQISHFRIKGLKIDKKLVKDKTKYDLKDRLKQLHKYMDYSLEKLDQKAETPQNAVQISELLGVEEKFLKRVRSYLQKGDS